MINETDLSISNKSYINKDFASIYNELIDLAKKIAHKIDPESSNESDAFIVLLKLLAFIGDKNCYNSDKNILERFMPSATQFASMQELCANLGYNMHYYVASKTDLMLTYNDSFIADNADWTVNMIPVTLKAFETKFTTNEGNINFVLTEDVNFYQRDTTKTAKVIQGTLKSITTLNEQDNSLVTLQDLDNNFRLYFPEAMVAENGIFISGGTTGISWTLVDNLNIQSVGSNVYVFRYDSKTRLPYIQFPDDIASLIGDGLTIKYIVTNGSNGNVGAGEINTLSTNATSESENYGQDALVSSNFVVTNVNAVINGQDIESIDEAYNNFNKTVGTFDTLVTCRDYANYIYRLIDENTGYPRVSNVQVCDRRDDYNYATKVVTFNDFGVDTDVKPYGDITPFDLCLYPLNCMTTLTKDSYKSSFLPLYDTRRIRVILEDNQTISHNYKQLDVNDIYLFKNYYQLNAKISTTYKVNSLEQLEIRENILKALMSKFNARNIDYGYEIPYDSILETIEGADSRIKSVSLYEPDIKTKVLLQNPEASEQDFNTYAIEYVAKNILGGRVPLWKYYKDVNYEWGETDTSIDKGIETISTCYKKTLAQNVEVTVGDNEIIQIMSPNFLEGDIYPYGWFYKATLLNGHTISADGVYKLITGESIIIYSENNDSADYIKKEFKSGDLVKPNFEITNMTGLKALTTKQQIAEVNKNQDTFEESTYLYWVTNTREITGDKEYSRLVFDNTKKCVLQENEYVYKTDKNFNVLFTYGPGTLLQYTGEENPFSTLKTEVVTMDITTEGVSSIKDLFKVISFTPTSSLVLTEQQIITLTSGDKIKNGDSTSIALNDGNTNKLIQLSTHNISYKFSEDSEYTTLGDIPSGDKYYIRARLDIDAGPTNGQTLSADDFIYYTVGSTPKSLTNTNFKLKYEKSLIGGNNINIQYYEFLTSTALLNDIYTYTYNEDLTPQKYNAIISNDFYKFEVKTPMNINLSLYKDATKDNIILLYFNDLSGDNFSPTIDGSYLNLTTNTNTIKNGLNILRFNNRDEFTINMDYSPAFAQNTYYSRSGEGSVEDPYEYTLLVEKPADWGTGNYYTRSGSEPDYVYSKVTFKLFTGTILMSDISILDGLYNDGVDINNIAINPQYSGVVNTLTKWASLWDYINNNYRDIFYFTYPTDKSKLLEEDLSSPYCLFEPNNVVNKIILSEIDIDYAIDNITIAKSSQL